MIRTPSEWGSMMLCGSPPTKYKLQRLFEVEGGMNLFVLLAFNSISLGDRRFYLSFGFSQSILSAWGLYSIILTR